MKNISEVELKILAVVTRDRDLVGGATPIFYTQNEKDQETIARDLARALRADIVRLSNGIQVIVPVKR